MIIEINQNNPYFKKKKLKDVSKKYNNVYYDFFYL